MTEDSADPRPPARSRPPSPGFVLENEFARARVSLDVDANGPRMRIEDLRSGRVVFLDPLEVASLTWLVHEDLRPFLDPSQTGWRTFDPKEMT